MSKSKADKENETRPATPDSFVILTDHDVSAQEFERLMKEFQDPTPKPEPVVKRDFPVAARAFYINVVRDLKALSDAADLNQPGEFHTLLWMTMRLGGAAKSLAAAHYATPSMVSKWVHGEQTPSARRRRGILISALASLDDSIERRDSVPFREFAGRRATGNVAAHRRG